MSKYVLFVLLAVLALSTGCRKQEEKPAATEPQAHQQAVQQAQNGNWQIELSTEPAQPTYGKDTIFRVKLGDATNKPVTGADVKANLKMQTMDMGKNIVKLADKGDGTYEGKGQFSMAGPWNVIVEVANEGKTSAKTFPIVAKKQ